jgi:actin-related protein
VQELVPGAEPLPASIMRSIMAVDMDIRRDLVGSVLCVGGCSSIQGLTDRVGREIAALAPVRGCSACSFLCALHVWGWCVGGGGAEGHHLA